MYIKLDCAGCFRQPYLLLSYTHSCVHAVLSMNSFHLSNSCASLFRDLSLLILHSENCKGWKGFLEISAPTPAKLVPHSRSHRKASRWVLNVPREGDPTIPLGSLFQCSVTLTVKKIGPDDALGTLGQSHARELWSI